MPSNGQNSPRVFAQIPAPALRPLVKRFLIVEFPDTHADTHLPDTSPVAALTFRGRCRLDTGGYAPTAAFTGLRETLRSHDHQDGHAVLLTAFTPAGAGAFVRQSLEGLTGTTTDLAGIVGNRSEIDRLADRIAAAASHEGRVKLMENFLLAKLRAAKLDPLVSAAVAWLERPDGAGRIDALTQYIGLSQSALERRFRRVIGISPKRFASVARLQRAARLGATGSDYTAVAQAAGYFDQSHFIHDFRRATGKPPAEFFRQRRSS